MQDRLSGSGPRALLGLWRHGETALLLLCLGLLFWLKSLPTVSSPSGHLGSSALSLLAALAAAWVAPGFVLWRLCWKDQGQPWWEVIPFAFGLGLAWLLLPASLVMRFQSDMVAFTQAVVTANAMLLLGYVVLSKLGRLSSRSQRSGDPPGPKMGLWILGAAFVAGARALYVSTMRPYRFTAAGDEWAYMINIRRFLETASISDEAFDVWDVVLALVLRLSGLEVIGTYRRLLSPLLVIVALTAFLALARRVLGDANKACLALTLLVILCLSDMYTRGEGAGMGLLVRIAEDKYACLFIALPLAQSAFLEFLGSGRRTSLGVCMAFTLVATLLQPFAVPWLGLSCGAVLLSGLVTRRVVGRLRLVFGMAATMLVGIGLAAWLRSLRPAQYFHLYDPGWSYNAILLDFRFRQLMTLSLEKGWYMVHPWQVSHPLVMAALLGSPLLLRSFTRDLGAQFLLLSALLPTLLVFNPVTAPLLGDWVTPWRLHWLLWVVPTPLILGALLHEGLTRLVALARKRWPLPPAGLIGGLGVLALVGVGFALEGRMAGSLRAFKARNRIVVSAEEQEFMRALAADPSLSGTLLAPEGQSIRIGAWTTRLKPVVSFAIIRSRVQEVIGPAEEFLEASTTGPKEISYLTSARIDYIMAKTGSPIDRAMRSHPVPFRLLHGNGMLSLYAWRPQYWSAFPPR